MTEQTELRPLKRSIPPDLQERVEDIQIKVPRTSVIGQPDDLDDRKKRWLIVGICLHSIISPVLRTYVVPVVTKLCYSLTSRNKIHKQIYGSLLEKYTPTNTTLNYQAINSNKTKTNKAQYDYRVRSAVDFSRLFLQTHMAHFTAFDDSCDLSALLGIIVSIDRFPKDVQYDAKQIRSTIRNPWAHCDFSEWDAVKYADSFQLMGQLVKHLCLSSREENRILGELNRWATNGQSFLKGTVLGLELVDEIRQQTHVLSEYMQTLCTEADNHFIKVQKELRGFENDLMKVLERIRNLENRTEKHDEEIDKVSSLTTSVSREMEDFKAEVKRQVDHIPKNMRDYCAVMDTREDNLIDRLRHFFSSIVMEIIHVYLEREVLDKTSLYVFLDQYKHQLFHKYLPTVFCCQCYRGTPLKSTYKSAPLSTSQFSVLYACSTENEFCFEKRDKLQRKEHCICKFDPKNVRVPQLDITLVLAIINICYMHGPRIPPGHPKWLQEIKEVRNFLLHHGDRSCLSKADFEDKWQLLETNSLSIARISGDSYMLAVQNRILSCKNETNVRLRLKEPNIIKK